MFQPSVAARTTPEFS